MSGTYSFMFAHEGRINANNSTRGMAGIFMSRDFECFLMKNFQFIELFLGDQSEIFPGSSLAIENQVPSEYFGGELGLPGLHSGHLSSDMTRTKYAYANSFNKA